MRAIPLTMLRPGMRGRVVAIHGGRGLAMRLYQMGFVLNTVIEVISNNRGPVIVRVRGATVALGRGIASRIMIMPMATYK